MTDTIHPVMVVPIFAPIITPADSTSERRPAFTKLTVITVVAEDDCNIPVIKKPVKTPVNLLLVIAPSTFLMLPPATC